MPIKKSPKKFTASIENASIIHKFTVLFLVMSIIPMGVLYYLFLQVRDSGEIQITESEFTLTLVFVVFGVAVGFAAMKTLLNKIIKLTAANTDAVRELVGHKEAEDIENSGNEIEVLSKSFVAINQKLEENVKNLKLAKEKLHSVMTKVGHGIANIQNIDTFLELIVETVTNSLVGKRGVLLLFDKDTNEVWMESVYGADVGVHDKRRMKVQVGTAIATVLETKKPIIVPRMIMAGFQDVKAEASLFQPPLICAPLLYHDGIRGVLLVSGREEGTNFNNEEMQLLMNLATQTAIALENSKLTDDIENAYFETIAALALAVDAKDKYSRGHLERVAHYSVQIGKKIGLDDSEIKILRDAAKLHDLGKIGIPDTVLLKEKALTDDEWVLMRKHPEIGEGIIRPIKSLEHLCDIIRHHHEKLDGSGYPDGLIGDAISPLVRITTIADIYDALTTNRPYRNKHTQHEAIAIMKKMEGQLDVEILDVFIEALDLE